MKERHIGYFDILKPPMTEEAIKKELNEVQHQFLMNTNRVILKYLISKHNENFIPHVNIDPRQGTECIKSIGMKIGAAAT